VEAPGGEDDAADQKLLLRGGGFVKAVKIAVDLREDGGVLAGEERLLGESAMPESVEADFLFAGGGFGARGFAGVALASLFRGHDGVHH
jgi:hypothetical protein